MPGNNAEFLEAVAMEAEELASKPEATKKSSKKSKSSSSRSSSEDLFERSVVKPVLTKSAEKVRKRKKNVEESTQDQSTKPEGRHRGRPHDSKDAVRNVP